MIKLIYFTLLIGFTEFLIEFLKFINGRIHDLLALVFILCKHLYATHGIQSNYFLIYFLKLF